MVRAKVGLVNQGRPGGERWGEFCERVECTFGVGTIGPKAGSR